jgi:release factor glutamine methyltransferase
MSDAVQKVIHDTKQLFDFVYKPLRKSLGDGEARATALIIIEYFFDMSPTQIMVKEDIQPVSKETEQHLLQVINAIKTGEPVQYTLGETEFYGLTLFVDRSVLIPRPETEELVDLIIKENTGFNGQFLDIGTGSGCIAISLAKGLPDAKGFALDISKEAIAVAMDNMQKVGVSLQFFSGDILEEREFPDGKLDLIVSNPPYIREQEKAEMSKNVLDHEPGLALFVPDEDPLRFYKAVGEFGIANLSEDGKLYFEISEFFGSETKSLLESQGYKDVVVIQDINGKDRMVRCHL